MPSNFNDGDLILASHIKQYSGEAYYGGDSGASGLTYAVSVTPPPPATGYPQGMIVNFRVQVANSASPTLNVNGLGAKNIVKEGGTNLAAGDLKANQVVSVVYNSQSDRFHLVGAGGASGLDALTDVTVGGATPGQVLRKTSGEWQNATLSAADVGAAAASHQHSGADITSGTVGLARGGTNANLSATGGANQVLKQSTVGGNITVGALTAAEMPAAIDAAKIGSGTVSNAEFGYLDGVTSAIQTQLDDARNAVCCVVHRTTNKTWGANYVLDVINWDAEGVDTSNLHSTSSNNDRINLTKPGKWFVHANLALSNNTGQGHQPWFGIDLFKNTTQVGASSARVPAFGYSEIQSTISQIVTSSGSDYVQLKVMTDDWQRGQLNSGRTNMTAIYLGA